MPISSGAYLFHHPITNVSSISVSRRDVPPSLSLSHIYGHLPSDPSSLDPHLTVLTRGKGSKVGREVDVLFGHSQIIPTYTIQPQVTQQIDGEGGKGRRRRTEEKEQTQEEENQQRLKEERKYVFWGESESEVEDLRINRDNSDVRRGRGDQNGERKQKRVSWQNSQRPLSSSQRDITRSRSPTQQQKRNLSSSWSSSRVTLGGRSRGADPSIVRDIVRGVDASSSSSQYIDGGRKRMNGIERELKRMEEEEKRQKEEERIKEMKKEKRQEELSDSFLPVYIRSVNMERPWTRGLSRMESIYSGDGSEEDLASRLQSSFSSLSLSASKGTDGNDPSLLTRSTNIHSPVGRHQGQQSSSDIMPDKSMDVGFFAGVRSHDSPSTRLAVQPRTYPRSFTPPPPLPSHAFCTVPPVIVRRREELDQSTVSSRVRMDAQREDEEKEWMGRMKERMGQQQGQGSRGTSPSIPHNLSRTIRPASARRATSHKQHQRQAQSDHRMFSIRSEDDTHSFARTPAKHSLPISATPSSYRNSRPSSAISVSTARKKRQQQQQQVHSIVPPPSLAASSFLTAANVNSDDPSAVQARMLADEVLLSTGRPLPSHSPLKARIEESMMEDSISSNNTSHNSHASVLSQSLRSSHILPVRPDPPSGLDISLQSGVQGARSGGVSSRVAAGLLDISAAGKEKKPWRYGKTTDTRKQDRKMKGREDIILDEYNKKKKRDGKRLSDTSSSPHRMDHRFGHDPNIGGREVMTGPVELQPSLVLNESQKRISGKTRVRPRMDLSREDISRIEKKEKERKKKIYQQSKLLPTDPAPHTRSVIETALEQSRKAAEEREEQMKDRMERQNKIWLQNRARMKRNLEKKNRTPSLPPRPPRPEPSPQTESKPAGMTQPVWDYPAVVPKYLDSLDRVPHDVDDDVILKQAKEQAEQARAALSGTWPSKLDLSNVDAVWSDDLNDTSSMIGVELPASIIASQKREEERKKRRRESREEHKEAWPEDNAQGRELTQSQTQHRADLHADQNQHYRPHSSTERQQQQQQRHERHERDEEDQSDRQGRQAWNDESLAYENWGSPAPAPVKSDSKKSSIGKRDVAIGEEEKGGIAAESISDVSHPPSHRVSTRSVSVGRPGNHIGLSTESHEPPLHPMSAGRTASERAREMDKQLAALVRMVRTGREDKPGSYARMRAERQADVHMHQQLQHMAGQYGQPQRSVTSSSSSWRTEFDAVGDPSDEEEEEEGRPFPHTIRPSSRVRFADTTYTTGKSGVVGEGAAGSSSIHDTAALLHHQAQQLRELREGTEQARAKLDRLREQARAPL